MLYATKGDGELQKNQGEYVETLTFYDEDDGGDGDGDGGDGDGGSGSDEGITLTKEELSDKIIDGRNEGIEKGKKDVISTINDTLGTDFNSTDEVKENLSDAHIGDITESDVVQDLQGKLKEKDEKIQSYESKIQDMRVKDKLMSDVKSKLDDKDLALPVEDVKTLHDQEHGYTEKDGELYVTKDGERVLNDSGQYMTYAESIMNYAKNKNLIEGSASGGSGGGTNPSGGDSKDSENPWVTGNLTKQAQIMANDKDKAERLKKRANN